ncbi:putative Ulp1 protease family catalytic domain, papain-like cysteine peptidase superfamily [Arabidopsis thaliana]
MVGVDYVSNETSAELPDIVVPIHDGVSGDLPVTTVPVSLITLLVSDITNSSFVANSITFALVLVLIGFWQGCPFCCFISPPGFFFFFFLSANHIVTELNFSHVNFQFVIVRPCAVVGLRRIQMRYFVAPYSLSSKLDGRFQYDKKTKLLVGHPSPVINQVNVDPEERFQNSLKKLKAIRGNLSACFLYSSISICGGIALSNKDILDLIDRKKNLTSKVMDALIRFSRHLLRTDDVDGEKLRLEVLDSKFLFTEAHYIYQPFNFDKKHWVALAVALKCRKIIVLDSNIQRRKDSAIHDELMPLAVMLPYVTTASRVHKEAG